MLSRLPTSSKAVAALLLPRLARSGAPSAAAPRGAPFLSTTPPPPARRLHAPSAAAADSGTWSDGAPRGSDAGSASRQPPAGFASLERMLTAQLAGGAGGPGGNWREVADCFVLYPPEGAAPRCLVHFIGGSFVGAAPQLAYGPLLEALAARGTLVVAVPYATSFDHMRVADEVHFKFERCLKALGPQAIQLPRYGVGHSLGALLHCLIGSRYPIVSAGNVLMSYNNRPATDSIPLLSPLIAPNIRALGPILSQLATSPLRSGVEQWIDLLRGASPSIVKQIIPLLDQLTPIYLDIANGTQEFTPAPEESRSIIRQGYTVPRNLLLRFSADEIDETPQLASTLQSSAVASMLELTVKTLPGEHARPLQQDLGRISPDLARLTSQAVTQGESLIGQLGNLASQAGLPEQATNQLSGLAKLGLGMTSMLAQTVASATAPEDIEALADEVAGFCGLPPGAAGAAHREPAALPAAGGTGGGAAGGRASGGKDAMSGSFDPSV
ncbi:plant MCA23-20 [Micractinium conductrix]|uniref:Plant MCA23-20 n=1 Tax=Micractinium conductrix TaxID=554055 RepID=A0A2P6VQN8_9CHLO|nr:plant MCA23-20 [Micractinium conductrix]|eukprot:PSC76402.1 plant MCA23-20 [Micractinium conductrix]